MFHSTSAFILNLFEDFSTVHTVLYKYFLIESKVGSENVFLCSFTFFVILEMSSLNSLSSMMKINGPPHSSNPSLGNVRPQGFHKLQE